MAKFGTIKTAVFAHAPAGHGMPAAPQWGARRGDRNARADCRALPAIPGRFAAASDAPASWPDRSRTTDRGSRDHGEARRVSRASHRPRRSGVRADDQEASPPRTAQKPAASAASPILKGVSCSERPYAIGAEPKPHTGAGGDRHEAEDGGDNWPPNRVPIRRASPIRCEGVAAGDFLLDCPA